MSPISTSTGAKFESVKEWSAWKSYHGKSYQSESEEVEKHVVWLANKEYVDQHNANAHIFGFKLDLNHLGDMVCAKASYGKGDSPN
jgi:cathepsin L